MNKRQAILCIVSGPSGSGKTTLCQALRQSEQLYYTVSCTTRQRRTGEAHGRDYFFLNDEEFAHGVATGEMLEYATVHGKSYGTLKSEVLPRLRAGQDVIMDLDTQGAAQLRACHDPEIEAALVDVFILPASLEDFRARLASRLSETPAQMELRMSNARLELRHWPEYTYAIVSGTREQDLAAIRSILTAERLKSTRLHGAGADEI